MEQPNWQQFTAGVGVAGVGVVLLGLEAVWFQISGIALIILGFALSSLSVRPAIRSSAWYLRRQKKRRSRQLDRLKESFGARDEIFETCQPSLIRLLESFDNLREQQSEEHWGAFKEAATAANACAQVLRGEEREVASVHLQPLCILAVERGEPARLAHHAEAIRKLLDTWDDRHSLARVVARTLEGDREYPRFFR